VRRLHFRTNNGPEWLMCPLDDLSSMAVPPSLNTLESVDGELTPTVTLINEAAASLEMT
jgi:hypothetical protein